VEPRKEEEEKTKVVK